MPTRSDTDSTAVRVLHKRIEADPGDLDARKELARHRYRAGDRAGAVTEVLNVARILMHDSLHAEAIRACREALAVLPEHTESRALLAQLYARMPELQTGPRVAVPTSAHEAVVELTPAHRVEPAQTLHHPTSPRGAVLPDDQQHGFADVSTSTDFEVIGESTLASARLRHTARPTSGGSSVRPGEPTDSDSVGRNHAARVSPDTDASVAGHQRSGLNPAVDDRDV